MFGKSIFRVSRIPLWVFFSTVRSKRILTIVAPLHICIVFSRRFRIKCTTLIVASFYRQFNAIGPLFCSFVQHHQLEIRTSKTYSKRQNLVQKKNIDVQNLENIGSPLFFTRFFLGTMWFFWFFWIPPKGLPFVCFDNFFGFHQRVSPSFVSIFCNTMDVKKSQRVPPFTFFGTVTLFRIFFLIFLKNLQRVPFNFFSYFGTNWSSTKPKGSPPFYNFEPKI